MTVAGYSRCWRAHRNQEAAGTDAGNPTGHRTGTEDPDLSGPTFMAQP